jgi:DNA polymerase-3 subunit beta
MKARIDGESLNAAASWAAKLAPTNPANPVVGGVLLTAGEHLSLAATDFDLFGTVTLTTDAVFGEGRALVSAKLLAAVTKLLGRSDEVELVAEGSTLTIKRGRARWGLPLMDLDLYPATPELGVEIGRIPADVLRDALRRVLPAVSVANEDAVRALTGVEITPGDALTLAATDRYRVAALDVTWQRTLTTKATPLLVPGALLKAATDTLNGSDIAVHADDNLLAIVSAHHIVMGRLLADRFPPWRGVIPAPEKVDSTVVTVDTAALLAAVKGVGVFSAPFEPIELAFTAEGVHVVSHNQKRDGESDADVELVEFTGDDIAIWCNPHYLADALNCVGTTTTALRFGTNPAGPFLVQALDGDGMAVTGYQHVIVALRPPVASAT